MNSRIRSQARQSRTNLIPLDGTWGRASYYLSEILCWVVGVADTSGVIQILGFVVGLFGVVSLIRPDVPIAFSNERARLITRPFLHGHVGGEARTDDPLQRLISRLGGIFLIIVGTGLLAMGLLANNR